MVASPLRRTQLTRLVCPRSLRMLCPLATSQRMSDLSELHETNLALSRDLQGARGGGSGRGHGAREQRTGGAGTVRGGGRVPPVAWGRRPTYAAASLTSKPWPL